MLMNFGFLHLLVILALLALEVVALIQVWRDSRRSLLTKVIWTVVIVMLPLIGGLGWLLNWSLGKATDRLNRRSV
ncbi:MAG: hypothetical protein JWP75_924 [Frondihabitans sp.]|nr:hypothetical protein [Frondihabitans sp.]